MTRHPRVLVLGAAGFIGRELAERLAIRGVEVIAATRRPTRYEHDGIRNAVSPFEDAAQFVPLLDGCTAVIHAASASTPGSSAAQPQLDGNLRTTLALVEALQDSPRSRLIFLSSGGTLYGERDIPANESDPLRPRSYHGAGKAAAEHFIHAWAAQYGGTAVVLRPSNVYGPGQQPRAGFAIIPTALACTRTRTPLTVWGDGLAVRDYLYIDDFVALCIAALDAPMGTGSHVFNVSSHEGVTLNALIEEIENVTRLPVKRRYRPARTVDIGRILTDSTHANRTFDWIPAIPLQEGLRRTWQWFQTQH